MRILVVALLSALGVVSPSLAKSKDDAFLKKIESELNSDKKTETKTTTRGSFMPDISLVFQGSASYFIHKDAINQTGGHDPNVNGFSLNAIELSFSKSVDPYFRAAVIAAFHGDGVELEEAYGETIALPWGLKLRAGLFLSGFGRINSQHAHSWTFVDQPLFLGKLFGGEGNRVLGGELTWLMRFLPWYALVGLTVHMPGGDETNRSLFGDADRSVNSIRDIGFTAFIKQFFKLSNDVSLLVGVSGVFGPNGSEQRRRTAIYGVDLLLKYRPVSKGYGAFKLTLQGEWAVRQRETPQGRRTDSGGYLELSAFFTRRWQLGLRGEHQDNLSNDSLDPDQAGSRQRVAMALSFWPSEFSRIVLQGNLDRNRVATHGTTGSVMLQLQLNFGVHPPHAY